MDGAQDTSLWAQEGRHSERCMFVYDGVIPTLMKFLRSFYGSYSYSGFRSGIAVDPYDTRGTANEIYQVHDEKLTPVATQTTQVFATWLPTRCLRVYTEHIAQTDLSVVPVVDRGCLLPQHEHSPK